MDQNIFRFIYILPPGQWDRYIDSMSSNLNFLWLKICYQIFVVNIDCWKLLVIQEQQQQPQPRQAESVTKKAPWSAVATQSLQACSREPTLAEIQRLEREKKLEQIKEQQQMMQIIAQQQAAALAREQVRWNERNNVCKAC